MEKKAFAYFWYETDPKTGLTRDRARNFSKETSTKYASVAASGFALSAYVIGVERGWINKEQAIKRIRTTLDTFANGPVRNEKGFFPHFVDCATGEDAKDTEISTIDTVLFLAGMIIAREYFHQDREIRRLSDTIFNRVDWNWARNGHPHFVTHGLDADGEFIWAHWGSITEGLIIYLLGLGSSAHRLPASTWRSIERRWGEYGGYPFLVEETYQSMFRYLYPTLWYDLRGRLDSESNLSFFENATLAALAMREYALRQASEYPASYGPNMWGLSACDGPGNAYRIYGFPPGELASDSALPDGTVVVYAMAGCMPLLPQHTLRAMRHLFDRHQDAWGVYGFAGSLNPTTGFIAADVIGIDVGTILLAIENYRSGTLWKLFMQNQWIKSATQKIGWKTYPHSSQRSGPVDLARNYQWRFRAGEGDFTKADVDDSSWLEVVVPEYWEHIHPLYREFDGVGWYRVKFQVRAKRLAVWRTSHSSLVLRIGGVRNGDRCYLNGELIGETDAASSEADHPRTYPIRRGLLRGGDNVLAVRVENHHGLGGIWRTPVCIGPDV